MDKILTFNGKIATKGGRWVTRAGTTPSPYNPLGLPAYTMRFLFYQSDFDPTAASNPSWPSSAVWTKVTGETNNIWDFTYENPVWEETPYSSVHNGSIFGSLNESTNLYLVRGANTTGVTSMKYLFNFGGLYYISNAFDLSTVVTTEYMFAYCVDLINMPAGFDFSSVQRISNMFDHCQELTTIPDYDFSSAVNMVSSLCEDCTKLTAVPDFTFSVNNLTLADRMFRGCGAVESGALAMYNKLSASTSIISHNYTFGGTGADTVSGAAELAQIPSDWK